MYTAAAIYPVKLDQIDQAIHIWQEYVAMPAKFHGLKRAVFLTNRETGKCISIGWWDNKADADKFATTGEWATLVQEFEKVLADAAVREEYEIGAEI